MMLLVSFIPLILRCTFIVYDGLEENEKLALCFGLGEAHLICEKKTTATTVNNIRNTAKMSKPPKTSKQIP